MTWFTKEQMTKIRARLVESFWEDARGFIRDPDTKYKSVVLMASQYWDDEANDAVHLELIPSELEVPDLSELNLFKTWPNDGLHTNLLPQNQPSLTTDSEGDCYGQRFECGDVNAADPNFLNIPAFAMYAPESNQDNPEYSPVGWYNQNGNFTFIREPLRPRLNNVEPDYHDDDESPIGAYLNDYNID